MKITSSHKDYRYHFCSSCSAEGTDMVTLFVKDEELEIYICRECLVNFLYETYK